MTDWVAGKDVVAGSQFFLELDGVTIAQFREVSGLSSETTVIELKQSGKDGKTFIRKMPGEVKWGDITLKRGFTGDMALYKWRKEVLDGAIEKARKNGSIVVYDYENKPVMRWNFINAWPSKLNGPSLNASSNEIAVEEVTLVHEGLTRAS